jgi:hypothetical protein
MSQRSTNLVLLHAQVAYTFFEVAVSASTRAEARVITVTKCRARHSLRTSCLLLRISRRRFQSGGCLLVRISQPHLQSATALPTGRAQQAMAVTSSHAPYSLVRHVYMVRPTMILESSNEINDIYRLLLRQPLCSFPNLQISHRAHLFFFDCTAWVFTKHFCSLKATNDFFGLCCFCFLQAAARGALIPTNFKPSFFIIFLSLPYMSLSALTVVWTR